MAEPVAALLRRSLEHLATEIPCGYRRTADALGPLVVEIDVNGEVFALRGGDTMAVLDSNACGQARVRIATSRAAICALLDAETSLAAAVDVDLVRVRGTLDDLLRAHDALIAYVHAAARAPSRAGLRALLDPERGSMIAVPTPASRTPPPTALVLGAGIAGLTAAHELAERGFAVTVVERHARRTDHGRRPAAGRVPAGEARGSGRVPVHDVRATTRPAERSAAPVSRSAGIPAAARCAVPGEHGFRFFPAYYLHIWDLLQRIPVYECLPGGSTWRRIRRTVMDNVQRVVTQATTVQGKPSLIFPREAPRNLPQVLTAADQIRELGATRLDAATFGARIMRYLVTSPLRRASELQNLSLYDFFIGRDATRPAGTATHRRSRRSCWTCRKCSRHSTPDGAMPAPTSPPTCS